MKESFTIRKASESDIPLLNSLANVAFRHTYANILSPEQIDYMMNMMYAPAVLTKQMADAQEFFIAEINGTPKGYIHLEKISEDNYHLQKIYVLPDAQGCGLGSYMFDFASNRVAKLSNGTARMELNVNRNNKKAQEFYYRKGMQKFSEGDFHIGNNYYMNDYLLYLHCL